MGSSSFNKYPQNHTFGGRNVLNLGCGFAKYTAKNVVNLDAEAVSEADVTWDLSRTPLPFQDNTFDFILANHILEHVPNWWACFEDCARILKTGGTMEIWVPGPGGDSVLGFRDHINTINHCSWWGTWGLHRAPNNAWAASHAQGPATRMQLLSQYFVLEKHWWIRALPASMKAWIANHLRNVVYEVGWVFKKLQKEAEVEYIEQSTEEAI